MPVARVFLRPDRVCLLAFVVDSPLWLPLATQFSLRSSPPDFHARFPLLSAFQTPSGLSPTLLPATSSRLPCSWSMPFPLRVSSLSSPSSSSSRSTPRVVAGFPRTPVFQSLPLISSARSAQQPRRKETDRSPSCATSLCRDTREKERNERRGRGEERRRRVKDA